jgi:hypothetical protein
VENYRRLAGGEASRYFISRYTWTRRAEHVVSVHAVVLQPKRIFHAKTGIMNLRSLSILVHSVDRPVAGVYIACTAKVDSEAPKVPCVVCNAESRTELVP